jgi:hypothetical protein
MSACEKGKRSKVCNIMIGYIVRTSRNKYMSDQHMFNAAFSDLCLVCMDVSFKKKWGSVISMKSLMKAVRAITVWCGSKSLRISYHPGNV